MRILLLVFFVSINVYANRGRPGFKKNSNIVRELLRQEKMARKEQRFEF